MKSQYFTEEHDIFRQSVRQFINEDVIPNVEKWEDDQKIDKEVWKKMGELGFLGVNFPRKVWR